jgi:anti-sigma regulatory factor (Ser/Thr protein kinase)
LEVAEIITACGEAATNAIEHAAAGNSPRFSVTGSREGEDVAIEVRDHGTWRERRDDDHGRGIELMRTLMDTVDVEPGAGGTTVRLRRRLGQDGAQV